MVTLSSLLLTLSLWADCPNGSTVRDISESLGIPLDGVSSLSPSRPNLSLSVTHNRGISDSDVARFLRSPKLAGAKSVIVYVTMQVGSCVNTVLPTHMPVAAGFGSVVSLRCGFMFSLLSLSLLFR